MKYRSRNGRWFCSECEYSINHGSRLFRHLYNIHGIIGERDTSCRYCTKEFVTAQQYAAHEITCYANPKSCETIATIVRKITGRTQSPERRKRLSDKINNKVREGTWHHSFAHSRTHHYKGESFDGTWELKLAQWFDVNHIEWVRNKIQFPYTFEGRERFYEPDFYLPIPDCFIEVKGWKTSKDEAKWGAFPHRLLIFSGTDLVRLGLDITVRKDWK